MSATTRAIGTMKTHPSFLNNSLESSSKSVEIIQNPKLRQAIPVARTMVIPSCDRCTCPELSTLNQPMRGLARTQYSPDPTRSRPAPGGIFNSFPCWYFLVDRVGVGVEKS